LLGRGLNPGNRLYPTKQVQRQDAKEILISTLKNPCNFVLTHFTKINAFLGVLGVLALDVSLFPSF
jgi:hypothetical protein